jgi:hypothetical protein
LSDSRALLRGANIYCHGQQANHVVFNPQSKSYDLFLRGRTEPGKIGVIDAGYAHGIRDGTFFGVYAYSIQGDWNRLLGRLVVDSIHDTQTNVKFPKGKLFVLPPVFFAVELDSELDTINAYILGGAEHGLQSIPGLKIVDSQKDAEIALEFGHVKNQDAFHATWIGIESDKEDKRITTVTTTDHRLSSPDYSPAWLPVEDLRIHVRNFARFKYHVGRSIPRTGFSTLNLDWELRESGQVTVNEAKVHHSEDNFFHIQLKEQHEMRGPFYITLRNPNRFPVWPHVFMCVGDQHVISESSA